MEQHTPITLPHVSKSYQCAGGGDRHRQQSEREASLAWENGVTSPEFVCTLLMGFAEEVEVPGQASKLQGEVLCL